MEEQLMDAQQAVFSNSKVATNMPFFDGNTLIFCRSSGMMHANVPTTGTIWKAMRGNKALAQHFKDLPRSSRVTYRPWKLAYCDWNDRTVRPIATGIPANIPERSPSFYYEGGRIHLSFIAGIPTSAGFRYRLYTCSGPDLEHLDKPRSLAKPPLFFGFVSPHHICWGAGNVVQLAEKANGRSFKLTTSFYRVAGVTFLAEEPTKLLITGILSRNHDPHTVLHDLSTGNTSDVSAGGPVYKSTLHGNHLIFAQKLSGDFEDRELRHGDCVLSPSTIQISKGE